MSDIINIKDFYNHETRITMVENAVTRIDKKLDDIEKNMRSDFRWVLSLLIGLAGFIFTGFVGLGAIMAHGFHWF
jgi:hypothetical protein